jgi:lysozyme family protein
MASFDIAYPGIKRWEGGYASGAFAASINDPGGETYRGIARKFNPNWSGWKTIDGRKPISYNKVFSDLEPAVAAYYKSEFWDKLGLGGLKDQNSANIILDMVVNQTGGSYWMITRALGDMSLGNTPVIRNKNDIKNLISRINAYPAPRFFNNLYREREAYYKYRSVAGNQQSSLKGWLNRLNAFYPQYLINLSKDTELAKEFGRRNFWYLLIIAVCIAVAVFLVYNYVIRKKPLQIPNLNLDAPVLSLK